MSSSFFISLSSPDNKFNACAQVEHTVAAEEAYDGGGARGRSVMLRRSSGLWVKVKITRAIRGWMGWCTWGQVFTSFHLGIYLHTHSSRPYVKFNS